MCWAQGPLHQNPGTAPVNLPTVEEISSLSPKLSSSFRRLWEATIWGKLPCSRCCLRCNASSEGNRKPGWCDFDKTGKSWQLFCMGLLGKLLGFAYQGYIVLLPYPYYWVCLLRVFRRLGTESYLSQGCREGMVSLPWWYLSCESIRKSIKLFQFIH